MIQTLQLEGYKASAFEDLHKALAACSTLWPGVVICDVRMPIMDGLDVLKQILEIDSEIPVIMFSAHSDVPVAIKAIRLGAYDFLEKTDDPQHHLDVDLFLDEIESMPVSLQVRLLIVLQERTLQRLGGNVDIEVDIRVLAATKVNLRNAAERWMLGISLDVENSFEPLLEDETLDEAVASYAREKIITALKANNGQIEQTANALGIPRKKLYLRMKKHRIEPEEFSRT